MMNEELSKTKRKRRNLILEVAYKTFLEKGIIGTSMNDIADNCEITRRTIYNYFESKTELLQYLIIQIFDNMGSDFKMNYDNEKSAIENLEDFFYQSYSNFLKHKIDVLFVTEIKNYLSYRMKKEEYTANKFSFYFNGYLEDAKIIINKGIEEGSIREVDMDIDDLVEMLYQAALGYLSNISLESNSSKKDYLKKCNQFTSMVIYYLKA